MGSKIGIKDELRNIKMKKLNIRQITFLALFSAITALVTFFIKIPGMNASYYHLGETVIFTIALVFGRKSAALSAALGSALVDLMYAPVWVPFTIVIKAFEAWITGTIAQDGSWKRNILAVVAGVHVMIIGYALATWVLYGWPSVLAEVGGNYFQGSAGAVIALPLAHQLNIYLGK